MRLTDAGPRPDDDDPDSPPTLAPKEPQAGLHAKCSLRPNASAQVRCQESLICVHFSLQEDDSRCLERCRADIDCNDAKRKSCLPVWWDGSALVHACVAVAKAGEACDLKKSIQCTTGSRSAPTPHAICVKGKCVEAELVSQAGGACDPSASKPKVCDSRQSLSCIAGACMQQLPSREGLRCDRGRLRCGAGFVCASLDGEIPVCRKDCKANDDCKTPLAKSRQCVAGVGCVEVGCKRSSDCGIQVPPATCLYSSLRGAYCHPHVPGYTRQLWELCPPGIQNACRAPYACISKAEANSFCSLHCETNKDCAALAPGAVCRQTKGMLKFCHLKCSASRPCPSKMSCLGDGFCGYKYR